MSAPQPWQQLSQMIIGFWVPRAVLSRFVDSILTSSQTRRMRSDSPADLSKREQEVLNGLLENLANKDLADRLHLGPGGRAEVGPL